MSQLTLLYLLRGNSVLLAMKKRGFGAGKWNGVGGKLEAGESVEEALVRECQEEIGVTPLTWRPAADIRLKEFDGSVVRQIRVHAFVCEEWDGQPVETEEMAPRWFDKGKLPFEQMWANDPFWLPQVLAGQSLHAKFELDEQGQLVRSVVRLGTNDGKFWYEEAGMQVEGLLF